MYEIIVNYKNDKGKSDSKFLNLPFIPKIGEQISIEDGDYLQTIKIVTINIVTDNRSLSHIEIN